MGLWDFFRRPNDVRLDGIDARLRAVESSLAVTAAEWPVYREQFTRLAQRLEKRDQRAAVKVEEPVAVEGEEVRSEPQMVTNARRLRAYREGRR